MMKYSAFLCAALLAGCGVNKIPENSDIKASLVDQFGECKYIKISNVNKTNGRDLGNGRYLVEQEFSLELLPESRHNSELEKIDAQQAGYKKIHDEYLTKGRNLEEEYSADTKKIQRTYYQRLEELEQMKNAGQFKRAPDYAESGRLIRPRDEEADQRQAINEEHLTARANRSAKYNEDIAKMIEESLAKAISAGYLPPGTRDLPVDLTIAQKRAVLKTVLSEFDAACNKIKFPAKGMVLQLAGVEHESQLKAFTTGSKKDFKETVTYKKTENGWMR